MATRRRARRALRADCKTLSAILAIGGAIIGFVLPLSWHLVIDPPSASAVFGLMNSEVQAAVTRDTGAAGRLYAPDATVTDAGCQTQGATTTWRGPSEISRRYRDLPSFDSLHHVGARVSWDPPNRWASRAEATADTIGVIAGGDTSPRSQSIIGHERWAFVKTNDRWVVQSFTYNLCMPAGQ